MGRFVASLLMTVDGFEANDEFNPTAEEHQVFNDQFARTGGMVCDRGNYELLVPYWDEVDVSDPAVSAVERQFAETFRTKRRFVVSDSFPRTDELATLIQGDPVARLRKVKAETSDDLLVAAGPGLLATLFDHDLIDELEILVLPVVTGDGARQVGELARNHALDLIDIRGLPTGAVWLHYQVKPATP